MKGYIFFDHPDMLCTSRLILTISFLSLVISCTASAVEFANIRMCADVKTTSCEHDQASYSPDTIDIFLTGQVLNATPQTQVAITWKYHNGEKWLDITSNAIEVQENLIYTSLRQPERGWPIGEYEAVVSLSGNKPLVYTKRFSVQ